MTTIGLAAAKGSPGVTTSAVLLAAVWQGAVLLEADPAGGDLRYWYTDATGAPLRADLGVVSLLTSPARPTQLDAHVQYLSGGLPVLVGPGAPSQVEALRGGWRHLVDLLDAHRSRSTAYGDPAASEASVDVVVDAGALTGTSALSLSVPLLRSCDLTLLVCRATAPSLAHTRDLLALLRDLRDTSARFAPELLLIGPTDARHDAARSVDLPVDAIHVLPDARDHAAAITGAWTRRLDRSPLLAATRTLATTLHERLVVTPTPTPPASPACAVVEDSRVPDVLDLREEASHL